MASLIAKSPLSGMLPLDTIGAGLTEVDPGPIFSLQPLVGKVAALSKALKKAHGVGFPEPGVSLQGKGGRIVWSGREQAFLFAQADPGLADHAAVTDQSDGWACMALQGPLAPAVLARLCPLDLRLAEFPPGRVARSQLGHVMMVIERTGPDGFTIMVMRSFAATAVHDLSTAMTAVAARGT